MEISTSQSAENVRIIAGGNGLVRTFFFQLKFIIVRIAVQVDLHHSVFLPANRSNRFHACLQTVYRSNIRVYFQPIASLVFFYSNPNFVCAFRHVFNFKNIPFIVSRSKCFLYFFIVIRITNLVFVIYSSAQGHHNRSVLLARAAGRICRYNSPHFIAVKIIAVVCRVYFHGFLLLAFSFVNYNHFVISRR